jgi:hypothetical protein
MLHDGRKKVDPNRKPFIIRFRMFLIRNKKPIRNFIFLCLIIMVLFFPVFTGNLIGNWIKDFIGSILHIIQTI